MRPRKVKEFLPALPVNVNEPRTFFHSVHLAFLRFLRVRVLHLRVDLPAGGLALDGELDRGRLGEVEGDLGADRGLALLPLRGERGARLGGGEGGPREAQRAERGLGLVGRRGGFPPATLQVPVVPACEGQRSWVSSPKPSLSASGSSVAWRLSERPGYSLVTGNVAPTSAADVPLQVSLPAPVLSMMHCWSRLHGRAVRDEVACLDRDPDREGVHVLLGVQVLSGAGGNHREAVAAVVAHHLERGLLVRVQAGPAWPTR